MTRDTSQASMAPCFVAGVGAQSLAVGGRAQYGDGRMLHAASAAAGAIPPSLSADDAAPGGGRAAAALLGLLPSKLQRTVLSLIHI